MVATSVSMSTSVASGHLGYDRTAYVKCHTVEKISRQFSGIHTKIKFPLLFEVYIWHRPDPNSSGACFGSFAYTETFLLGYLIQQEALACGWRSACVADLFAECKCSQFLTKFDCVRCLRKGF